MGKAGILTDSPVLMGDNTIPGVKIPKEMRDKIPHILEACRGFGLDFYPTVVEYLTQDEISEIAAYGGFPNRYPHWTWGMQYEELSRGYEYGQHVIYEMVVNTNPCYIYNLDSNTFVDHVTVVAHATGHNDFFKNNIFFSPTSGNMMNELANHGSRIRRYSSIFGRDTVGRFIDKLLSIDDLIDPGAAWKKPKYREPVTIASKREFHFPRRLEVPDGHDYMEQWINPDQWIAQENSRIKEEELERQLGLCAEPSKDIFGFLKNHAPLEPWQQDITAMFYEESMYFSPQRFTKTINEGWASYVDFNIMARMGWAECSGIFEYAKHKAGVLGGKYAQAHNPYNLGFKLFLDIEDRWNKGKFGDEYENCQDMKVKEAWDKKLGLGHEKVFEVRRNYNDLLLISEYFTQEFCDKWEFYEWKRFPNGEYKIVSRDHRRIKELLLMRYKNGGLPDIRRVDHNFLGKGHFLMQHYWDGRLLDPKDTKETLCAIYSLWKRPVALVTKDKDGQEFMYSCTGTDPSKNVKTMSYSEYRKSF